MRHTRAEHKRTTHKWQRRRAVQQGAHSVDRKLHSTHTSGPGGGRAINLRSRWNSDVAPGAERRHTQSFYWVHGKMGFVSGCVCAAECWHYRKIHTHTYAHTFTHAHKSSSCVCVDDTTLESTLLIKKLSAGACRLSATHTMRTVFWGHRASGTGGWSGGLLAAWRCVIPFKSAPPYTKKQRQRVAIQKCAVMVFAALHLQES